MKAAVVHEWGQQPRYLDFPEPQPRDDAVVATVEASALTNLSRMVIMGKHYSSKEIQLPAIAGVDGVARLDPRILLPVALGAAAAILLFARAAQWLFGKAEGAATRGVLGLVVGSLWLVYPGWPGGGAGFRCLGLFLGGAILSAFLNKLAP